MKALVTGASGFIGSTLIEEMNRRGIEVHALMRKTSLTGNLKGLRFERVEGDLADSESLRRAVAGMDFVFHLAGVTAAANRDGYFRHNAEGTRRLAEAAADAAPGLRRFVYVSSLAAGGPAKSLAARDESWPDDPVSAYGESKLQGERELLKLKHRVPVTIVRPPMVYGPRDKGVFVMIQTVARRLMPILQGSTPDGHKHYSAIHSFDLCQGILLAAGIDPTGQYTAPEFASGEVFYLSDDGVYTYRDLLSTAARHLGLRPFSFPVPKAVIRAAAHLLAVVGRITRQTYPLNPDKLNEILPDYWICSNQKARRQLGFRPRYDLNTGMSDAIEWYKREKWI